MASREKSWSKLSSLAKQWSLEDEEEVERERRRRYRNLSSSTDDEGPSGGQQAVERLPSVDEASVLKLSPPPSPDQDEAFEAVLQTGSKQRQRWQAEPGQSQRKERKRTESNSSQKQDEATEKSHMQERQEAEVRGSQGQEAEAGGSKSQEIEAGGNKRQERQEVETGGSESQEIETGGSESQEVEVGGSKRQERQEVETGGSERQETGAGESEKQERHEAEAGESEKERQEAKLEERQEAEPGETKRQQMKAVGPQDPEQPQDLGSKQKEVPRPPPRQRLLREQRRLQAEGAIGSDKEEKHLRGVELQGEKAEPLASAPGQETPTGDQPGSEPSGQKAPARENQREEQKPTPPVGAVCEQPITLQVKVGRAEAEEVTSPTQSTQNVSFSRANPRTISFRVNSKKESSEMPFTRSASMRIPPSRVKLEEKLEKYNSAVQRSESIKCPSSSRTDLLVAPLGVASKRSFFEKEQISSNQADFSTSRRKEDLKLSGVVTTRLNQWISRSQKSREEREAKDVQKEPAASIKQPLQGDKVTTSSTDTQL
ncbi:ladinin-1 isoform X2 [Ornithorhynchus anatinus]|uniref:ladinin-1 isoform X2 n=1 Tax=Ornithorhynchus anatinus TaxID=9258 RepID=UPI0010A76980|nr:ladinin-1 isoform X2 [Ornithorhynchus anatinus]